MIVDDHAGFRTVARQLLESDGWRVVADVPGVTEAIAVATEAQPDVVLVDVQLLDGNGFDLCRALTALASAPEVVLISSREDVDYGTMAHEAGARGFIPKSRLSCGGIAALLA